MTKLCQVQHDMLRRRHECWNAVVTKGFTGQIDGFRCVFNCEPEVTHLWQRHQNRDVSVLTDVHVCAARWLCWEPYAALFCDCGLLAVCEGEDGVSWKNLRPPAFSMPRPAEGFNCRSGAHGPGASKVHDNTQGILVHFDVAPAVQFGRVAIVIGPGNHGVAFCDWSGIDMHGIHWYAHAHCFIHACCVVSVFVAGWLGLPTSSPALFVRVVRVR